MAFIPSHRWNKAGTYSVERQQGGRCKVSRIVADGKCIENPKGFSLRFLLHTRTRTHAHTHTHTML